MRKVVREFGEVSAIGFGFLEVETDEEAARLALDLADGFRQVSDRAEAIEAPSDVAKDHEAFISGLNRFAATFASFASSDEETSAAFHLQETAMEDLSRALTRIQSKGYDLNWR